MKLRIYLYRLKKAQTTDFLSLLINNKKGLSSFTFSHLESLVSLVLVGLFFEVSVIEEHSGSHE